MADDQEKTEDPTPKKLEDARKKGDIPQSKEFASFVVLCGLALSMYFGAEFLFSKVTGFWRNSFMLIDQLISDPSEMEAYALKGVIELMWMIGPVFGAVFVFGILAYVGQFGFLFTGSKLLPDFKKIDPLNGIKKIFSRDTVAELVKSILKVLCLSLILYYVFKGEVESLIEIGGAPVPMIFQFMMESIGKLLLAVLLFVAVLGIADFAYQRWSFFERQKMSLKELKDEFKSREGDPHVKGRIRQIQRERARARMMEAVPTADVIVANPTHVAVALKYTRGEMRAPMVVAKGAGFIALKIKELGINSGVPVMEKRSLARYLYRNVEVGQPVPESLFSAVAEVLAYVYKIKRKYKNLGLPSFLKGQGA